MSLQDPKGDLRFDSNISNAKELKAAIESTQSPGLKNHTTELLNLYELVFNHRAFTGRSGTMFGFEGLGCIYWHMVSKVCFAVRASFHTFPCGHTLVCMGALRHLLRPWTSPNEDNSGPTVGKGESLQHNCA